MVKLSNALHGNDDGKGGGRKRSEKQLDLFLSLNEREDARPRLASSHPAPQAEEPDAPASRPEPEMVLPPVREPPDVAAEVRAVLSDSDPAPAAHDAEPGAPPRPPLRTGIYRRPARRPLAPPEPTEPPRESGGGTGGGRGPFRRIGDWFAGVELDRRLISLVVVLMVLVALAAFWSACPRDPEPGTVLDLSAIEFDEQTAEEAAPAEEAVADETAAESAPETAAPEPAQALRAPGWDIAFAEVTQVAGVISIRFTEPVFVSADNISKEGMKGLRSLAAKLKTLDGGARVVVTGHTDDVPLSTPTEEYASNADLAEARAQTAMEHLKYFARSNKALDFEMRAGSIQEAPYPNDSNRNRRLNRTATVRVIPAGAAN